MGISTSDLLLLTLIAVVIKICVNHRASTAKHRI